MKKLSHICVYAFVGSIALTASVAAQARDKDPLISGGVGIMGVVGGNFINKGSDQPAGSTYPGFGGVNGGGGLMLEGRLVGIVGLELDILRTTDHGSGDITLNNIKYSFTIGQAAWHVPLLLKFSWPLGIVRPNLFFGPEFVAPSASDVSYVATPAGIPYPVTPTGTVSGYTMFTAGIGFEFKLPIPMIDLRIPLSFRGSLSPGLGGTLASRQYAHGSLDAAGTLTYPTVYHTEWMYQVQGTLGAAIYF